MGEEHGAGDSYRNSPGSGGQGQSYASPENSHVHTATET